MDAEKESYVGNLQTTQRPATKTPRSDKIHEAETSNVSGYYKALQLLWHLSTFKTVQNECEYHNTIKIKHLLSGIFRLELLQRVGEVHTVSSDDK